MATYTDRMLMDTATRLEEIVESLEEFADWATDLGYLAITHKIEEATGRIENAAEAARQYARGELEPS